MVVVLIKLSIRYYFVNLRRNFVKCACCVFDESLDINLFSAVIINLLAAIY